MKGSFTPAASGRGERLSCAIAGRVASYSGTLGRESALGQIGDGQPWTEQPGAAGSAANELLEIGHAVSVGTYYKQG